ncbi:baseplate hub subunit and tail lysozyme [Proteus phage vB_PMC-PL1]|uniref:Putative peptidoglycan hydrolase n=1 Tax=Proteus phage PM135 TaxID=2048008 RepID=A0A2H4PRP9_9CAUD|nr:baseplate hub subunit and tail lysozyme [Proteus phage PM135]QNN97766.1 peptidoglycan endopeptidase [Proteus phage 1]QNN97901.1 putative peptidoglycan hydrolase [Proteus phage 2]QOC55008.1 putative peptidoglycan hydrolase [Proteus phage M4H10_20]UXY92272.1 hypothetical protein [Proteus phage RP7]ATW69967.1 putative peptidoglycan hydrolase [Proteus phage PM135]
METRGLPWLVEGYKLLGIHEATKDGGAEVDKLWKDFKMGGLMGSPTTIPWCSGFVGGTLTRAGLPTTSTSQYNKASSQYWLGYGTKLSKPAFGCIVVFKYPNGNGHVGYVVGKTSSGLLLVLGGNQSDMVCVKAFKTGLIQGYVFPEGNYTIDYDLPIGDAELVGSTR